MPVLVEFDKKTPDLKAGNRSILKEVNGVNGIPKFVAPGFPDLDDQFNQMGIIHMRLHDILGIGDIDDYYDKTRNVNQNQFLTTVPADRRSAAQNLVEELGNRRVIFPNAAAGMAAGNLELARSESNYEMTDAYLRDVMNSRFAADINLPR